MDDNRDYIHLNELEKLTLLTKEQVFDAVERGVFRLHAKIDCPDAAAVDSHNVLLYSLHVRGFIELTQKQSLQVLVGKCQLTRFKAVPTLAYAKPRLIKQAFPSAVKGQFNGIYEQRLSSKNIAFIVPKLVALYPEQESMMQIAKDKTSQGQVSSLGGLLSAFTEIISESTKQLSSIPIGLQASDIRLCTNNLSQSFNRKWQELSRNDNRLSNQAKPVTNSAENQAGQGLKPQIETNPVKMIQHRILTLYPQAKAREVWNLIREDVREERYRFDVDVIIDGIDNERLYTSKDTADGMSFKRFQNMLSEVRKGIRE
ncbi:hypothetical protein F0240_02800 [Vibrio kanaloae]|uniref:hypothetical protein n=1 Tax=Vibrio kanaloae TaxID=170673 RepID=UPI00148C5F16|nr:hypothetical protein [Vibrio kanaloae]NOI98756.1 hypothetical protein [Vibrio kanaloae]